MTVISHPATGTIVRVDLSEGFRPPEMVKRRPAVILSSPRQGWGQLCVIVPLSTKTPVPQMPYHMFIRFTPPLPSPFDAGGAWLKGDCVLTVAFHRLRLLSTGSAGGKRQYDVRVLDADTMARVKDCVRHGIGL